LEFLVKNNDEIIKIGGLAKSEQIAEISTLHSFDLANEGIQSVLFYCLQQIV